MAQQSMNRHLRFFLICLPFTGVLMVTDWLGYPALRDPFVQLAFCLPVYIVGMHFFGRSALKSLRKGRPNMNVLIALGATAAFVYSLTGTLLHLGPGYQFYETAAGVISFVFFGNYLEHISVRSTQKALDALVRSEKTMANMVAYDDHQQEMVFPVENIQLRSGDLILIREGERVPADARVLWGEAAADEAILTGESLPVVKKVNNFLAGGSILVSGTVRAQVVAAVGDSVLAGIVDMVRKTQKEKPPIRQLADRISAVFVPVVFSLALLTLAANYIFLRDLAPSLMRAIAVLVIACPCAMGLATPAAIAVGLGRAARQGILFRRAAGLESFKDIRQVVFDKTGTLTTGEFSIVRWEVTTPDVTEDEFRRIAFSLEKYSNHPIARSIARAWKVKGEIRWARIEEIKGVGMRAETKTGDVYEAGRGEVHNVYIVRNGVDVGWIDVEDTVRPEAGEVLDRLRKKGIRTILLSGDKKETCLLLAEALRIDEVFAEQSPADKLEKIAALSASAPTALVGDGINDAPALARATVGIAMGDASQLALQTADVVLMSHGLRRLPAALELGRSTYATIRQNLFWAFFYNIVAIPVAALGWLTPAVAAVAMGCSDVVLAANSLRLFVKKLT
ncbi:MAG TPA: cation-translocating P-type ATPase [Puia sp.]|nr:cation-translocating P-type ATPase [Puia sp.]